MSTARQPSTATPAQTRVREEVLAWGGPRPQVPPGLLAAARQELRAAVVEQHPEAGPRSLHLATALRGRGADGAPFDHDRATVRGILLARAFARDVERGHGDDLPALVAAVADELAGERPGDPASASAWLNAADHSALADLRRELVDVLVDVRELWPPLDRDHLDIAVRPSLRVEVAPGPVVVTVRPDLVLDSPRRDERARSLVVVARTGMPRPREDRDRVRATALVTALATDRVPFRWVTLHLTDGRAEVEDLEAQVLLDTARALGQRIAAVLGEGRQDTTWRGGGQR